MSGKNRDQTRVIAAELKRTNAATISLRSSRVRVAVKATNEQWFAASHALVALR
jgi:hypothetical protein